MCSRRQIINQSLLASKPGGGMRNQLFDTVVMALCLLLYGCFGWHYFYGSRGIAVQSQIEARQAELHQQLEAEIEKRRQLEPKVTLLQPEHLDPDFLDEMARRILHYVDGRELIILK
jgi:cell division protein FtsB